MPVKCEICGKEMLFIAYKHVKTHDIDMKEYRKRFPNVKISSPEYCKSLSRSIRPNHRDYPVKFLRDLFISRAKCKICGVEKHRLDQHLKTKHNLTTIEYRKLFPDAEVVSDKILRENPSKQPEWRERFSGDGNPAKRPEVQAKMKKSSRKRWNKPGYREEYSKLMKEVMCRPDVKENFEEAMKKMHNDPEYREKMNRIAKSPERCKKVSDGHKELWENYSSEEREERCITNKGVWDNYTEEQREERIRKMTAEMNKKPNKPEIWLIKLIEKHNLPFEYWGSRVYLGLSGRSPDFVRNDGIKEIIEYDGGGGHDTSVPWVPSNKPQLDDLRDTYYRSKDYRVLRLLPNDLQKGEEFIVENINSFMS